jgi:ubiquinone/menaquinone biosynthesis C-methylase UbiE
LLRGDPKLTLSYESAQTIKLFTRGRKSGLPHIAVVRFVFSDGAFFVLAGKLQADWALNAVAAGEARIRYGNISQEATCEVFSEKNEVLGLFAKKYGKTIVSEWYANAKLCLKLTPVGEPTTRGSVKGEGESTLDFDSWRKTGVDYYSAVSGAFDSASEEYDFTISHNYINTWIRKRSIEELLKLSRPDDTLLEIGCGTGAEAIEIAKHVSGVVATDISARMISLLERKIYARNLMSKVQVAKLGASEIGQAARYFPNHKVRLAYSFNGALNCELKVNEFPSELSKIMEPGGFFVCSIRNNFCLSEALAHALALQFNQMAPRKVQPVMVSVGGMDIPSYYYSPRKFAKLFKPYFSLKKMIGLPVLLPPAYLSNFYVRARRALFFADRAETVLSSHYPFNILGDQTLVVFQRREIAPSKK